MAWEATLGKRSRRGWGRDAREVRAREVGGRDAGEVGGEMQARLAHGRLRERFKERRVFIGGSGEHDRFPFLLRKQILAHGRDVYL